MHFPAGMAALVWNCAKGRAKPWTMPAKPTPANAAHCSRVRIVNSELCLILTICFKIHPIRSQVVKKNAPKAHPVRLMNAFLLMPVWKRGMNANMVHQTVTVFINELCVPFAGNKECPLNCQNGGICLRLGTAPGHLECLCPANFGGPLCQCKIELL